MSLWSPPLSPQVQECGGGATFAEADRESPSVGEEHLEDLQASPVLMEVVRRLEVTYIAAGNPLGLARVSGVSAGG